MHYGLKCALGVVLTAVFLGYAKHRLSPKLPFYMEGGADADFTEVGRAFKTLIDNGFAGGAFAVYHKGKLVADIWGGYADVDKRVKWKENTVQFAMSTTKGVSAICLALLVDRGLMSYDDPVSKYWPEFAQNGKEKVTMRVLFSHEAGLVAVDELIQLDDVANHPDRVGVILARQKPKWEPGTRHGYHAITLGLYADQVIRHVDPAHRGIQQFFKEEIAGPFGIDYTIGLTKEFESRVATSLEPGLYEILESFVSGSWGLLRYFVYAFYWPGTLEEESMKVTTPQPMDPGWSTRVEMMRLPLPSSHGFGTARAMAKLFSATMDAGAAGKRLISENTMNEFLNAKPNTPDVLIGVNNSFSVGMLAILTPEGNPLFGHTGFGGQYVYADPRRNLAWALVTNHMKLFEQDKDIRYNTLLTALYNSIKGLDAKEAKK